MLDEVLESPMFWACACLGVGAELLGWIFSRQWGMESLPLWQLIVLIAGTLVASGVIALKMD